jgi:hypothetical protein
LHDIYHYQENNKTKLDTHKWKCEICGKYFQTESHIDKHFEVKHKESLQNVNYLSFFLNQSKRIKFYYFLSSQ